MEESAKTSSAISAEGAVAFFTSSGQAALAQLAREDLHEHYTLAHLTTLRASFSPSEAGALLALARLRRSASSKFPFADQLFLLPEALEQATAWPVALHHAAWLDQYAAPGPLLDLGCGIGGDLLALAQKRPVIAVELDPLRLQFAQANAAALGLSERITFIQGDWTRLLDQGDLDGAAAAFVDPARRVGERRVFSLQQMQPPLSEILRLQKRVSTLGVKVMPSVRSEELPSDCSVEFISHEGVCKEALLWFGEAARQPRWASVYTGGEWITLADDGTSPPVGEVAAGHYLYEPDPAVIRAQALGALARQLEAWLLDAQIAYLVTAQPQATPLAKGFVIDEVHPFSLKVLNRRLQVLGIGDVELKKRGFPVEPESLRPRLKVVRGGRPATIFLTRRGEQRLMLIGRRLTSAG